ncbi:helix-turn-helix transcriptional regulator [Streptomyces sp. NEAU-sy36]|uniref:helix-turn-helix domain-containing protein n=1 Tax=unclassified Streptomyces TaxID=2593676 RepID=UPI0015D5D015|nr:MULTISPECIES: helix-turn-helix transcriptional regulator [unclassified Streptomyces]QLJ03719.1 helix-turn-helix transcriptional regulator [Streptomyces sp. NEAU-sy36]
MTGPGRKTTNRIEQGTHATSIDHLLLIADALDVPLADLVRWDPAGQRTGCVAATVPTTTWRKARHG